MDIKVEYNDQLIKLENENKMLRGKLNKVIADKDYIAMMTGVDIPEEQKENE